MISARCVASDLHTIAPGPLERTCRRKFAALWGYCKKISNCAFECDDDDDDDDDDYKARFCFYTRTVMTQLLLPLKILSAIAGDAPNSTLGIREVRLCF